MRGVEVVSPWDTIIGMVLLSCNKKSDGTILKEKDQSAAFVWQQKMTTQIFPVPGTNYISASSA